MREFVIKNNPENNRASCEKWFKDSDGNKLVYYMIRNKMLDGRFDVYIKSWGRWMYLDLPTGLATICDKRCYKKALASYRETNVMGVRADS